MENLLTNAINILNTIPNQKTLFGSTYDLVSQLEKLKVSKLHVIQYEHGGIPDEPSLFLNDVEALAHYEKLLVDEGFRARKEKESADDYLQAYWQELDGSTEESKLDFNNTVRWWIYDLTLLKF